ncbi:MAG TPA: ABC transporter substrate-binding protein [Hyphomicrobiaceae bacterium]|nr:ABC transporter substrate-binding protein [Hyphomicrobiaceae bacterium]
MIFRVASGTYDIGTGDVNSLIRFRDENPSIDLKVVMMVYDRPPFAIVGRRSKGITRDPESLKGRKLSAPPRTEPTRNGRSSSRSMRSTTAR